MNSMIYSEINLEHTRTNDWLNIVKLYCITSGNPPKAEQKMFTISFSFPDMQEVESVLFSATVGAEKKVGLELNRR